MSIITPSQKKGFTGSYEKSVEILDELQDTTLKGRKVNNCGKNYWTSISLNLKNRHVWENVKHTIIS